MPTELATAKQRALQIVDELPEDSSCEDILRELTFEQAAADYPAFCSGGTDRSGRSTTRSWFVWRLTQNSGVVSNACARSQAVSEVIPRFPRTISLIRWTGTPRCSAKATCVRPNGFRN